MSSTDDADRIEWLAALEAGLIADPDGGGSADNPPPAATGTTDVCERDYAPFPVESLPQPFQSFVRDAAAAIGCDPAFIALPVLTAAAAAVGNTRRLIIKRGWFVPPIIWTAVVGESGTAKTPAFRLAIEPIRDRQSKAIAIHEAELALQQAVLASGGKGSDVQVDPPARCLVSDTTVEALAPILKRTPRGVLLACDELAGWFGSFDRYAGKGRGGGDSAHWLSMFNADAIVVDRKTGIPPTIFVPHAAVCICGGIQPAILQRALGRDHRENGLAARLLLAYPPRRPKSWTEADISDDAKAAISAVFDKLFALQPVEHAGELRPALVRLAPPAKAAFVEYFRQHAAEQAALSGDLAAAWSKLEEYAARLALVVHFIHWAAGESALDAETLDADSMAAGIDLATWFKAETRRVYSALARTDEERQQSRLVEWIRQRGGSVTAREAQMTLRDYRRTGEADAALEALAKAGIGHWHYPTGGRGRPTRVFILATKTPASANRANEISENAGENRNIVGVGSAGASENGFQTRGIDEWGNA